MAQDDLFELIHSLTPGEKRYFKLHAKTHVRKGYKNHYEKLFDALNNWEQGQYAEKQFRIKHKGKAFLKNFAYEKNYLRELILRVMRPFAFGNEAPKSVFEHLPEIRFLITKGRLKAALLAIKELAPEFEKQDNFLAALWLKEWQHEIHNKKDDLDDAFTSEVFAADCAHLLAKANLVYKAGEIEKTFSKFMNDKFGWERHREEAIRLNEVAEKLLNDPLLPASAWKQLVIVRQAFLFNERKFEEAFQFGRKAVELVKPRIEKPSEIFYASIIYNYLNAALELHRFEVFPEMFGLLKRIFPYSTPVEQAGLSTMNVYFEVVYLLNANKFISTTEQRLNELEAIIEKHKRFIPAWMATQSLTMLSFVHFFRKDWNNALRLSQKVYRASNKDKTFEMFLSALRPIEFLCHAALGNYKILESQYRSLRRYYKKCGLDDRYFEAMFKLLGKIASGFSLKSKAVLAAEKDFMAQVPPVPFEHLQGQIHFAVTGEFIPAHRD